MAISVLIPDGDSHLLIYVVNSLSQVKDVEIYIMSNQRHIPMRYSRHIFHFSYYPKTNEELEWIKNINEESKKHKIDVIMAIYEKGIEALIKYKDKILFKDKLCLLPAYNNFKIAKNKWKLAEHLLTNNLPFPKSYLYNSNNLTTDETIKFPIIVKPTEGIGGGTDVNIFKDLAGLQEYFAINKLNDHEFIIQEYIEGYDIGCSVLCKSGSILAFTIQKATMNADNPFAPLLGVKFVYEEQLYEIIVKLIKSLNWSGVAHVDCRFDIKSNTFKIIEVNTRFWGSLDASLIAGVNFPYLYCLTGLNKQFELPKYKKVNYLNLKGLVKSIRNNVLFIFHFKFILNNTSFKYALNDPVPMVYKFVMRTKNIILEKIKHHFNRV
ncbi:carbamoyl phosphate synthase-like protein [Mariniflexile rhizosphaerae]|uniref:carboxylate--amine ligase n=1 Tax=unclassified Mariniflexile TaxID=2643887 RepID=UPI000E33664F|nr:ATP-grasp domain-containing protein [Mariniflexile sp. TRM1-10]AXP79139.1 carbamoyl phosphate synthase-like protein [Mariniflexile sp. TRM1-10]